jgi:hypothetical protein
VFDYRADVALDVECHSETVDAGLSIREVSFDNGVGGRALATLIVAARPSRTAVILAHGGMDDGRHFFRPEATRLVRNFGMTALLPATRFPPHGDRRASHDAIRASVVIHRRGLDLLSTWVPATLDRFCFFGHSGGAFQGAYLSGVEPRLHALALASAGSGSIARLASADLPANSPATDEYLTFLRSVDTAPYVARAGTRRLLFQHGRDDHVILRSEALRLYEAAAPPRLWREYPCGHDTAAQPQTEADRARFFTADS